MVVINEKRCRACGDCIKICHENCMFLEKEKIRINYEYCSTCTQCIAICPSQTLSWDHSPPLKFSNTSFPAAEQVNELLAQRRTIRLFKDEKPPRTLVEEIVHYGALAPSHHHEFRIMIIDNTELLDLVDKAVYIYNRRIYRILYKSKWIQIILRLLSSSSQYKEYSRARPKLEESMKLGKAYSNPPPVIVLLLGRKDLPLSIESAQYILFNMILYGMTKGIGCRLLVGNQMFLNNNIKLKKRIGIDKKERIYGTLGMGYPSVKFRNKVTGRQFPIQWNGADIMQDMVLS
jgi:NAD-dependent dihydropyrimidine dehydrogenase PreA subunit